MIERNVENNLKLREVLSNLLVLQTAVKNEFENINKTNIEDSLELSIGKLKEIL